MLRSRVIGTNVPKGSTDSVLPGNIGTLQEGSSPRPLTDNHGGCQSGFDHTAGSAVEQG